MRSNIWCDYGRLKMPNTTTASPQTVQVDARSYREEEPPIGEEEERAYMGLHIP